MVIGPESTGKSTLCSLLANHFSASWVPEYAREYLLTNGNAYSFEDLLTIAKGQVEGEQRATEKHQHGNDNSNLLFVDTDMYVMKVWCEYVFHKCHQWIIDQIVHQDYDLYLLCNTDLPWVKDELREYPDLETREKLYHFYKDIMVNQATPWVEITGTYDQRVATAIQAVDQLLTKQRPY